MVSCEFFEKLVCSSGWLNICVQSCDSIRLLFLLMSAGSVATAIVSSLMLVVFFFFFLFLLCQFLLQNYRFVHFLFLSWSFHSYFVGVLLSITLQLSNFSKLKTRLALFSLSSSSLLSDNSVFPVAQVRNLKTILDSFSHTPLYPTENVLTAKIYQDVTRPPL